MSDAFVVDAAVRRRRDLGALGLLVIVYLAHCLERFLVQRLLVDMSLFDMGTPLYRKALWSSTSATAALVAGSAALLVWLVARMARALLGLPRARTGLSENWKVVRVLVAIPVLVLLAVWSSDEVGLRGSHLGPERALEAGLALCLMFAYDVPRLARNGLAALVGHRGLVGARACPLGELPAAGLARTVGTVVPAGRTLETTAGPAVCVRTLLDAGDPSGPATVEVVPFYLDDGAARATVDTTGGQGSAPVVAELAEMPAGSLPVTGALLVGQRVEVIGTLEGGATHGATDAYRSAPRVISGGEQALYLVVDGRAVSRRLALAAAIELGSAVALAGISGGFVALWLRLYQLAQLDVARLHAFLTN